VLALELALQRRVEFRILLLDGGGGYNRTNLARAWTTVVENLM